MLFILIILPLFLGPNCIWGYSGNPTDYLQNLGTLNVYVFDKNQNPLSQITVSILKDNYLVRESHTDNVGKATFQLYPQVYSVKIYDSSNKYASSKIDNIRIEARQEISLRIELDILANQPSHPEQTPSEHEFDQSTSTQQFVTSTLNIFVKDENNNPLKGIIVKYNTLLSNFPQIVEDNQTTDENGKVSFVLAEGRYKISVFDPTQQYVFKEGSNEIDIRAGQVLNLEIKLQKKTSQIVKIKGKVLVNNQPVKEASVYLGSDKEGIFNTKTDGEGNFIFEISPHQKFYLQAQKVIGDILYMSPLQEKEVGQEDLYLNLNLEKLSDKPLFKETEIKLLPQEKKEIVLEDKTKIEIPEFTVSQAQELNIEIKPVTEIPPQKNVSLLSNVYEIQIFDEKNQEIKKLDKEIKIEIPYNQEFLKQKNIKENDLKIAYFDENKKIWIPLEKSFVDTQRKVVVGFISHLTKFAIIAFADIVPPQPPTNIKLRRLSGLGVQISWQNPDDDDFRHINIYRSEKKNIIGELILEGATTTSFIDKNVQIGKTYYYLLKAVDYAGNISLNTNQHSINLKQLRRFLKKGDRGDDVKLLQEVLVKEKLLSSDLITGYFGSITLKAVIKFQEKYRDEILKPWGFAKGTGFVGPSTLKKINKILEVAE